MTTCAAVSVTCVGTRTTPTRSPRRCTPGAVASQASCRRQRRPLRTGGRPCDSARELRRESRSGCEQHRGRGDWVAWVVAVSAVVSGSGWSGAERKLWQSSPDSSSCAGSDAERIIPVCVLVRAPGLEVDVPEIAGVSGIEGRRPKDRTRRAREGSIVARDRTAMMLEPVGGAFVGGGATAALLTYAHARRAFRCQRGRDWGFASGERAF